MKQPQTTPAIADVINNVPFARLLARLVWYAMLWFMRRPWVKAARRNIPNFVHPNRREKVWDRIKTQDAWAMKHGLAILTILMNLLIGYVFMVSTYLAILKWHELHPGPIFVPGAENKFE